MEEPDYLIMENGYTISENGTVMIAIRSEIPEVTGEAYDWWFSWHSVETQRYKLWNPVAHQYSWRTPETLDWTNKTYAERNIGSTSYIDEFVGQDAARLSIGFIDPEELGYIKTKWAEVGIETIVLGHILIGDYSTGEYDGNSFLAHQVRRLPNGKRELRSRFWIAAANSGTAQIGQNLAVHCNIETTHLGTFLPAIFQEFKDTK
ncbi:hypothetical protein CBS101457_005862 [Exobasidium rhododendri]|nr:hypothetical protein CBS101457_005862 [Exobasidium rhododendri]